MTGMQTDELCQKVCGICRETGTFLKERSGKLSRRDVFLKAHNDFVTEVDRQSEQKLVKALQKLMPEAGFITEEKTLELSGREYEWIIDPLDGTTNFIHGVPLYCISIALRRQEDIIMGVIYEPWQDECFYTWEGAPSFLNKQIIRVSECAELSGSLIATGFPNRDYSRMKEYMELLNDLMFSCHGIRRLGSAAVDLAYVACGRFEAFYEYYLSPWDVAAGAILVKNAGGTVSDFSGGENYLFGREIIASAPAVHQELLDRLNLFFGGTKTV